MEKRIKSLNDMIKSAIASNTIMIGTEKVLVGLRSNTLSKAVLAANCAEDTKEKVLNLAKLGNVEVITANEQNDELGIVCKKPFSISALGFLKV